jgi:hypothetical protein
VTVPGPPAARRDGVVRSTRSRVHVVLSMPFIKACKPEVTKLGTLPDQWHCTQGRRTPAGPPVAAVVELEFVMWLCLLERLMTLRWELPVPVNTDSR